MNYDFKIKIVKIQYSIINYQVRFGMVGGGGQFGDIKCEQYQ